MVNGETEQNTGEGSATSRDRPRQRASQACLPCHRRKLRCTGEWPCKRCHSAGTTCEYGTGRSVPHQRASATHDRVQQLERTVSTLVSALTNTGPSVADTTHFPEHGPSMQWSPHIDHGYIQSNEIASASGHGIGMAATSPQRLVTSWLQPSPHDTVSTSEVEATSIAPERPGKHQKAEERLALATKGSYEPPFRPLTYAPAVWENKEASRMPSPEPRPFSRGQLSDASVYDQRHGHRHDNPVNTGIISAALGETLHRFYIRHCHRFLPIIDISDDSCSTLERSPALFSCVVVIAARYYNRYNAHMGVAYEPVQATARSRLVNLAFFHLGQTLLSKRHTLEDVQAILLVAAWNIVGDGGGSDAWVATGHALRLMRRLGVHKQLTQAEAMVDDGEADWRVKAERFLPQWRTWLAWVGFDTFFSLGYGRPASAHFDAVNDDALLRLRLSQPLPKANSSHAKSRTGDIYLVSQVQLVEIGRDVRMWVERLAQGIDGSARVEEMEAFNKRLDGWCELWTWPGSPYTVQLGASAQTISLQAEHVRLCINSYALQTHSAEMGPLLRKAFDSATTIINAHDLSSQGDLSLSFAIDYHTITVAQAALFLIRLAKAAVPSHTSLYSPESVTHYIEASISLLETGDVSEIRFASFLARTVRGIAQAAGLIDGPPAPVEVPAADVNGYDAEGNTGDSLGPPVSAPDFSGIPTYDDFHTDTWLPSFGTRDASGEFMGLGGGFDLEAFLQFGGDDLSSLLALPAGGIDQSLGS